MTDLLDTEPDGLGLPTQAGQPDVTGLDAPGEPDPLTVDVACGQADVVGYVTDGLIVTDGPAVVFQPDTPAITRLAVGEIYTHYIRYGPHTYPQQITSEAEVPG